MPGKRGLQRCSATTLKMQRCKASAARDGLCECHHPDMAAAWNARNEVARQRYWQTYRAAKAMAELGAALE
jgi:hypothetical protein